MGSIPPARAVTRPPHLPPPHRQVLERAVAAAKMANGGKQPQLVLVLLPFKVRNKRPEAQRLTQLALVLLPPPLGLKVTCTPPPSLPTLIICFRLDLRSGGHRTS